MLYFRRRLLVILFQLSDMFIFVATLLIALWFVTYHGNHITIWEFFSLRIKVLNFIVFIGMLLSWHIAFITFKLYRSRRQENVARELKDILKATTMGTAIVYTLATLISGYKALTPLFVVFFWLSSTTVTISFRGLLRYALGKVRLRGRNLRLLLIVGTNQRAYDFAARVEKNKEMGYYILGYIDETVYQHKEGMKLIGTLEDFPAIIRNHVVDEVVITLPIKSHYGEIRRIVQSAEEQGIMIRYFCDLFNTKNGWWKPQVLDDFSGLTMAFLPQESWECLAKRAMDVIVATLLIIATLPLMVLVAIIIKLTSPGPILFIQDRVGYKKRIFRFYKFRTMVVDAEKLQRELESLNEMDGPVFKIRNDPRITKVGRWLRKNSIDELPQLFNVLKGDMSLVGPRPLPVRDYEGFDQDWQRRRFSALPGITCTWQISGRNNISFEDWMKLDMGYIDNWKLSEDLKILLLTVAAVIGRNGAE